MENRPQRFLAQTLAEAVDGALSRYDSLADEIYDLEECLRPHQTLGEFMDRCRSFNLSLVALEDKLAARAEAQQAAEAETYSMNQ